MAAAGYPDAWQEFCLICIERENDTPANYESLVEATDFAIGKKDVEGIPLVNGGRVMKRIPEEDSSVTLKMYPVGVKYENSGTATSALQLFWPQGTDDTSEPFAVVNTVTRRRYGLTFLWASTLPASAVTIPAADASAFRVQILNAYCTAYELKFEEGIMYAEVTFKWGPYQKDGTRNVIVDSTTGGTQLPAVQTF